MNNFMNNFMLILGTRIIIERFMNIFVNVNYNAILTLL